MGKTTATNQQQIEIGKLNQVMKCDGEKHGPENIRGYVWNDYETLQIFVDLCV